MGPPAAENYIVITYGCTAMETLKSHRVAWLYSQSVFDNGRWAMDGRVGAGRFREHSL